MGLHFISPDGQRILYDLPEVTPDEGSYPRVQPRGVRPRTVAIYNKAAGRPFMINGFGSIYTDGRSSCRRRQGDLAGFTTYCMRENCEAWGLAVVDYGGRIVKDSATQPGLLGLEFVAWSPDGQRIAGLRAVHPGADGEGGGELVEYDLAGDTYRPAGLVSAQQAADNLGRLDRLIDWPNGRLELKAPQAAD